MNPQLLEFKVFSDLEERFQAVTPEQLAGVEPGEYVDPEKVVVYGLMPDRIKALLVLRKASYDALKEAERAARRIPPGDERDTSMKRHRDLAHDVEFISMIFWAELKAEFPKCAATNTIGFNHQFEVYGMNEPVSLASLLGL